MLLFYTLVILLHLYFHYVRGKAHISTASMDRYIAHHVKGKNASNSIVGVNCPFNV